MPADRLKDVEKKKTENRRRRYTPSGPIKTATWLKWSSAANEESEYSALVTDVFGYRFGPVIIFEV